METIGKYKVHELASRLPMMPEDQFDIIKENIRTQGLMEPIIILSKKEPIIIDGRNRIKACIDLGIKPQFICIDDFLNTSIQMRSDTMQTGSLEGLMKAEQSGDIDATIKEIVLMKNVYRRHLSDFQRFLQLKAVEGYPEPGGSGSNQYQKSKGAENAYLLSDIATKLGWSERKIQMAQWLDKNAPEEIKEALMKNELSITTAYKEEKQKRDKKADWFDQHIEDENERVLVREAVRIKNKISKQLGILYFNEFIDIYKKINLDNYRETWNQA